MQSRIAVWFQQAVGAFVSWKLLAAFVVVSTFAGMPAAFAADNYLSELEAEAESSARVLDQDHPDASRADAAQNPAQHARVEFERALKAGRPSIHTFYGRLSDTDKLQVVERYAGSIENMGKAVNLTLDLYFKRK